MGEYVWTVAKVGGKLTREIADELGEYGIDIGKDSDDTVEEAIKEKRAVCFQGEVNYGNPESFMDWCRENSLAYNVSYAAAGGNFGSGLYYWFPGMEKPAECDADDDGRPTIDLRSLRHSLKLGLTLENVIESIERADPDKVPPLELVEDAKEEGVTLDPECV